MTPKEDNIENRANLENIPKKNIYSVSDGYFDKLPTRIQERVVLNSKQSSPGYILSLGLRIALPVIALIVMIAYFGNRINNNDLNYEAMLDDIPTEELISFINESDLSTDELLSMIDINELDVDGMVEEDIELFNDSELDALLEAFPDLETDI